MAGSTTVPAFASGPLAGAFHLVCVDLPGHGHSDHKSTPYVFVDWLDDLYQITQAAGWQRFILLGHSLGR